MVCREYMVDRHYVWCLMVGSIKWDNVQNESHSRIKEKGNEKYVCSPVMQVSLNRVVHNMFDKISFKEPFQPLKSCDF